MSSQGETAKRMRENLHTLITEVTEIETVLQGKLPDCVRKILTDAMAKREKEIKTLGKVLGYER